MNLSILIPARNEEFLSRTVQDILDHKEDDTEVIVGLDGKWANPTIPQHPDVNVVYVPESVGQRGLTIMCAKLARGKYVIKCDAHCSFEQGFDKKMLDFFKEVGDDVTAVPVMRNLRAFIWKCNKCGAEKEQGPTPVACWKCTEAGDIVRQMKWEPRRGTHSTTYAFDPVPHFQYHGEYKDRPEYKEMVEKYSYNETMSLQGSFFMLSKDKFFELLGTDYGSWGNQGLEVACATWLSGGRVLVNHKTWYAHMFRTQGGDFGFPYEMGGNEVKRTKDAVKDLFWQGKHPKQVHPVSWLVEKFLPIHGGNSDRAGGEYQWTDEDLKKLKELEEKCYNK